MSAFWASLGRPARVGLIALLLAVAALLAFAAWRALRVDEQPLFTDLKPPDLQAMATELDRLKMPYRVGDDGQSLWVDRAQVHATRLKLMARDLPLHGVVGLELFNGSDFGMTDFAQKVNLQRALQGELTRTIGSLAQVQDVRVLLALPEKSLFSASQERPKASVTLALRPGAALGAAQISGIQRLVASAVPGLAMADVTIVDGEGLALSRAQDDARNGGASALAATRLELARDIENHLARKANAVLERALGSHEALASVTVTLDMDQVRTTTEDVLPAPARAGAHAGAGSAAGVLTRERESLREVGGDAAGRTAPAGGNSQREADYAVGRRIEQVVGQPGSVQRLQVVAVVRRAISPTEEARLRELLGAAVGALPERGDSIVLHAAARGAGGASGSNDAFAVHAESRAEAGAGQPAAASAPDASSPSLHMQGTNAAPASGGAASAPVEVTGRLVSAGILALLEGQTSAGMAAAVLAAVAGAMLLGMRRRHRQPPRDAAARQRLIDDVRKWLHESEPTPEPLGSRPATAGTSGAADRVASMAPAGHPATLRPSSPTADTGSPRAQPSAGATQPSPGASRTTLFPSAGLGGARGAMSAPAPVDGGPR